MAADALIAPVLTYPATSSDLFIDLSIGLCFCACWTVECFGFFVKHSSGGLLLFTAGNMPLLEPNTVTIKVEGMGCHLKSFLP